MARKVPGSRSELIHCENCDEDYSATYKRCPFCGARPDKTAYTQSFQTSRLQDTGRLHDTGRGRRGEEHAPTEATGRVATRTRSHGRSQPQEDDYRFDGGDVFDSDGDYEEDYASHGGKRLAPSAWGVSPTRVAGYVFSAVLFVAAILIVALVIVPMVTKGNVEPPADSNNTALVDPSDSVSPSQTADPSDDPSSTPTPSDDPDSSPSPSETVPAGQTATSFTLDKTEFTISARYPDPVQIKATLLPAGSTGTISWTSSDPSVVTVDDTGLVTAVGKGSATITATLPGGVTQTCKVISSITGGTASPSPSAPASGSLTLSRKEFTISDRYPDPVTLTVTGASGTITWSTSDASVASVDANGTVSRVGSGRCTITVSDSSGKTASCLVLCS